MPRAAVTRRTTCRICRGSRVPLVFSLGETPLANELVGPDLAGHPQAMYPLDVHMCLDCAHVQLLDVVDPEVLFRSYVYTSGTSPVTVDHFRRYAADVAGELPLGRGDLVVEIGSNDGTLLRFFRDQGQSVLGIDPARNIARLAAEQGIETVPEFFNAGVARRVLDERGPARAIGANNVFAHTDDLHGLLDGVTTLLTEDGAFVFEVSYLLDVVEKTLFDTIYHEHVSYHSLKPLVTLLEQHGLYVAHACRVETQGGSLRVLARRGPPPPEPGEAVRRLVDQEAARDLHRPEGLLAFVRAIDARRAELGLLLATLKAEGKRIAAFGAPAKATTLLHYFGIGGDTIEYIVEDSPIKQGLFSAGHHIPIVSPARLADDPPDYLLILAWNFAESIMRRNAGFAARGRFIVPLPEVAVH